MKINIRPINFGIISAFSPIPMFIFSVLWSWTCAFGIGMGLLNYDYIPNWILVVSLLPMCFSPILGLSGIVFGIVKIKDKLSWLGIILSAICLLENLLIFDIIYYLGGNF